jgi:hypothetical protein
MNSGEALTKIVVDLPNHWATGGEAMWAKPLGEDLFEIRSVPFHAYGLSFGDVVRAAEPATNRKPMVSAVIRAIGYRTLRIFFAEAVVEASRLELLRSLHDLQASFERATERLFALDVEPEGNYQAVCAHVAKWESDGRLEYETCEQRAVGRFDDARDQIV